MSASLVGSEMCIRDRAKAFVAARAREASKAENMSSMSSEKVRTTQPEGCLLYTSDAADDM
eukprot:2535872-Alexandrium_andersonii.AAC.1